ncbi:hypothetical protein L208DRAFT_1517874 [Tricholoma matsutake]|nr:hypothetical protein L208DRAFT_1517874 [Tricholoma matsutake 945]
MLADYGQSLTLQNIFSTSPLMKDTVLVNGISFETSISTSGTSTILSQRRSLSMLHPPHSHLLSYLMLLRFYDSTLIKLNTSSGQMTDQKFTSWFEDLSSLHQVSRISSSSSPKDIKRVTHLYPNSSFFLTTPRKPSVHVITSTHFYPCHYETGPNTSILQ